MTMTAIMSHETEHHMHAKYLEERLSEIQFVLVAFRTNCRELTVTVATKTKTTTNTQNHIRTGGTLCVVISTSLWRFESPGFDSKSSPGEREPLETLERTPTAKTNATQNTFEPPKSSIQRLQHTDNCKSNVCSRPAALRATHLRRSISLNRLSIFERKKKQLLV